MKNAFDTRHEYYLWLCNLIDVEQRGASYWHLTEDLYNKPFTWSVPNDDNRIFEGKNLRETFCNDAGLMFDYEYDYFDSEASLLEVIIALAYRCEEILEDDEVNGFKMVDWFWKMMDNVGLDKFNDAYYNGIFGNNAEEVDYILDKIIDRTYKFSGKGGLFPLKQAKRDQRKVELWDQMNSYLVENYYS